MFSHSFFVCILLSFSLFDNGSSAIYIPKYDVINVDPKTPGGIKFDKIIGGVPYTKELMSKINKFVVSTILQQTSPGEQRKQDKETVHVYIKDFIGTEAVTYMNNIINVSAVYLDGFRGDLKWEFTSLMYHEFTHLLSWGGDPRKVDSTTIALSEGIADYTILKANYFPPAFAKPGSGDKWDKGYDFTARFFEYCGSITPGFVGKLNKKFKDDFNVNNFKEITGKPIEQLWKDYKAKYTKKDIIS